MPLPKKNAEPENAKVSTVKQRKTEPIKVEKEEQKSVSAQQKVRPAVKQ